MESKWRRDFLEQGFGDLWEASTALHRGNSQLAACILGPILIGKWVLNWDVAGSCVIARVPTDMDPTYGFSLLTKMVVGSRFPYGYEVAPDVPV